jgi:ABC-type glycerol-3-phosphate transport system substrate-binding protein
MSDNKEVTTTDAGRAAEAPESPGQSVISRRRLLGTGAVALGAAAVSRKEISAVSRKEIYRSINIRPQQAPVTLKLMSWEPYGQPYEFPAWVTVVSQFEEAYPNITVEWTGWPFATFDQEAIAQAETGLVEADVIMATPEVAATMIQKFGIGVSLNHITDQLGLIPDAAHDSYKRGSTLYALGVIDVAFALLYNEAMMKAAGVRVPTTPDELLDAVTATTKPPHQYGIALLNQLSDGSGWWNQSQNFALPYGGVWANIKGMEFWLELLKATQLAGSDGAVEGKLFDDDQINMNFNVAAGLSSLKTFAPKYYPQMRSVPPPWAGQKAIERLHPLFVNNKSKYIEEGLELVKWCVTPKNLWYLTTTNGYPYVPFTNFGKIIPAYAKYLDTIWLRGYEETNYIGEFQLLGEYTYAYAQLGQIIDSNLEKAITGSATITQALQTAQAQCLAELHLGSG